MKRFKRIYIEITNVCNLTCSICPGTKRKQAFMPPESFEAILKKIRPSTDYLYLHVMGEPLLHPEFPELMRMSETLGFQINIATNGVLIKKHHDTLMNSKALRQMNFSIHCLEIQRNSKIPENYLPDILEFIDETRKKSKAYFALRLWNMKQGDMSNAPLLKQIEEFFHIPFKLEDRTITEKGIGIAPNVFLNLAEEFRWPEIDLANQPDDSGFCRGLSDHCAILVDGTVVPCCLDRDGTTPLGNILETDFGDIINSANAQKIIAGFSEGKATAPLCKVCEFRKRFSN
ncbi:MAG: SPASM domain-containing protein [Victivallales bacterium]|jgi:radical SAM protein with 4Fe4S-binding SPASM domain